MDDLISRKAAIDALDAIESEVADGEGFRYAKWREYFENLPSAQPELIEKVAYIRGFEQGRTQGMIDAQGGKK